METYLALGVLGIVVGCIYGLTATGLVVTYTTSGVFNFAHGAIGMVAAFTYWQLTVAWGLPALVGLALVLLVLAPLFGALVERLLIRPIQGGSSDLPLVVTLGLLLFLIGVANVAWKPTETRVLPAFLSSLDPVQIGALSVTWNQLLVVATAGAVAVGLRLLFTRTRLGIAMRGVVDDPDLAAMAGVSPARVQQFSWALGATLASLAGILLAPVVNLSILVLTLLVINGYAAALFGRLKSLPLTAVGALGLGLTEAYVVGLGTGDFFRTVGPVLPMVFLFAALVLLPANRLRAGAVLGSSVPTVPSLRQSLAWGGALLVGVLALAPVLSTTNLAIGGRAFTLAITLLSLVLLTGYAGLVSLCQLAFVGLGAFAMGSWGGGSVLGLAAAVLLAAGAGALVALPTLRLRGLYLALATFAFANALDRVFFDRAFGDNDSLPVPRLELPLVPTESDQAFFVLTAVVFVACAVGVLAVRRGRWGRQLTALNDSPAACATLGLNTTWTKLVVFSAAAGLAGLSGALFGGLRGSVSPSDFVALSSLVLLLSLRIGGINTVTGALVGASFVALTPTLQAEVPSVPQLTFLLTGLAAVSIGRDPDGIGGQVSRLGARLRARRRPTQPADSPVAEEVDSLVTA
jgi:branched-chain amino acid transport system permease protein